MKGRQAIIAVMMLCLVAISSVSCGKSSVSCGKSAEDYLNHKGYDELQRACIELAGTLPVPVRYDSSSGKQSLNEVRVVVATREFDTITGEERVRIHGKLTYGFWSYGDTVWVELRRGNDSYITQDMLADHQNFAWVVTGVSK